MAIHAGFARAATRLTDWTQRWVPGTFTIAWLLTLIVLILGITAGRSTFLTCVSAWGDGFWELLPFSMQMCLIMFTGSIVAVSPPAGRALAWLASRPRTPRASILLVALCSMLLALVHWGISIVGSAVLVRELGRRKSGVDYRLLLAAAYLGMGTTWHAGLSASAPLLVATPGHFLESEIGLIPVSATIFAPFNLILVAAVVILFSAVTPLLHPAPRETVEATPTQLAAIHVFEPPLRPVEAGRPALATRLEYSRRGNLSVGALGLIWLGV